jgi:hypothetical protein
MVLPASWCHPISKPAGCARRRPPDARSAEAKIPLASNTDAELARFRSQGKKTRQDPPT